MLRVSAEEWVAYDHPVFLTPVSGREGGVPDGGSIVVARRSLQPFAKEEGQS